MTDSDPIRVPWQSSGPTTRELAMVLFRKRKVFVGVAALVLLVSVAHAIFGTKYQANMKILLRRTRAATPASAQRDAPLDLTRMAITDEELNSEVELLQDREVLRRVADETGLANHDWLHLLRPSEEQPARVERAARRLAKKLQIQRIKKTNLITVSYSASDPQQAARVLKAVGNAYLEKHTVVHRPSGEMRFFDQQKAEARLQWEEAKGRLLQFTARHRVVSAGQQRDLSLQKLSEVDANYRQTSIELAETQRRVGELQALVAKLPERTTTQVRVADNPELLQAIKSNLLNLQLKRIQLLTKFEPNHRLVQEVDQQIADVQATIAAENLQPLRDETTDKNAHYEWAKSELQRAQVQAKALEARLAATAVQEGAYQQLARQLGEDAITQEDLLSSVRAAQDTYLLYVKKQEEARLDDALDQRGIVDVAVAEEPVAPALPVWSAWLIVAAGTFAAGVSGTVAAFAADHFDPAFRNPDDVLAYLEAPVLASLPAEKRGRLRA